MSAAHGRGGDQGGDRPVGGEAGRDDGRVRCRRAKREWQWRSCGAALDLQVAPGETSLYAVMRHTTPMFRQLQGLPMQLQHNKITNPVAVAPLDGAS